MFSAGFIEFTIGLYWVGTLVNVVAYLMCGSETGELRRRIVRLENNNVKSYSAAYKRD